jgi:hypothetical protein
MQDPVSELPRIPIPRTPVNKAREEPGTPCLGSSQSQFLKLSLLGRRNRCRPCETLLSLSCSALSSWET